ncbi:hypothetical protein ACHAXR_001172, partial [Thalassiosira sp. AJA248-18]
MLENGQQPTTSTNNHQQQQQPHIIKELFHFFLQRSWKKKLFTILVILTIIPVFLDLFLLQTGYVSSFIDTFLEWMAYNPLLGVWAYVAMLMLASLIFIPPSILIFAAGFTFQSLWGDNFAGIFIALVASFLGSMMGGLIGFIRAKYMTRDLIEVLMRRYPIIKAVDVAVVKNSVRVMVLLRLNCLIPFGVLNYVFGITGVNWAEFILGMGGVLPWHMLLICVGAGAKTMYDDDDGSEKTLMGGILISMGIAFMIIGLVITWRHAKRELQKEVDSAGHSTATDYRIADKKLSPWRSPNRKRESKTPSAPPPTAMGIEMSIEDADLYAAEYFLTQCLGNGPREVEYGTDEDENYQSKLTWNE